MINDPDTVTLDKENNLLLTNGEPDITVFRTDMKDTITTYIAFYEIASAGVSITNTNAMHQMGEPSSEGTMRNLYNMMYHFYHQMEV